MIGDAEDVCEVFETKQFYVGIQKQEYMASTEFYSINELTIPEFKEKYGEYITLSRGFQIYLHDIMRNMNGDSIALIGDTSNNSIFSILI